MRALRSSPGRRRLVGLDGRVDEHEVGVAPGEADLDVPARQLAAEREGRLAEDVEQLQAQRRPDRVDQSTPCLADLLSSEGGRGGEVLLDRLDVNGDLHRASMTS